jgi:Cupin
MIVAAFSESIADTGVGRKFAVAARRALTIVSTDADDAQAGEMPYHVVVGGSAVLEGHAGASRHLAAGDILMLPHGSAHILHDGRGAPLALSRYRAIAPPSV